MKYTSTLIAVKDMDISKQFYHNVLGLNVVANFGANVTLDGGIVLQTLDTWKSLIRMYNVTLPNNAGELYFEEDDMDAFCNHLKSFDICYVHELYEHRWGQRVIRFMTQTSILLRSGKSWMQLFSALLNKDCHQNKQRLEWIYRLILFCRALISNQIPICRTEPTHYFCLLLSQFCSVWLLFGK